MNIVEQAKIEALIDIIAELNKDVTSFPSLKKLKYYEGDDPDILKLKIYALEQKVI